MPAAAVTEAFTWAFAAIIVGQAGGSALGGLVLQRAGPWAAFLTAGAAALAGTALGALCGRNFASPRRSRVTGQ